MFEPGTKVICINHEYHESVFETLDRLAHEGVVYTVRDIIPAIDIAPGHEDERTVGILLEEIRNRAPAGGLEPGFSPTRFRELAQWEIDVWNMFQKAVPSSGSAPSQA